MLRDPCDNFRALPCRQSVPRYQLQQEGDLASSKTKVCIRVKQLFTLFELQYHTRGRPCAWSFASFSLNLWQRVGWITMSFSLPSPPSLPPVVFFSTLHPFLLPPVPPPPPPFFPFALLSNYSSALLKFQHAVNWRWHTNYIMFFHSFFYKLTALLISL